MATTHDDQCVFCLIIQGTIPSFKLFETEHSLAFLDINPISEGHTQVIPKYHAKTLGDLPDEYLRDIGPVLKKVALSTGIEAYNIVQNNGEIAFQHVGHVHFHVLPKPSEEEGLILTIGQNWPQKNVGKEELAATLAKMKERL